MNNITVTILIIISTVFMLLVISGISSNYFILKTLLTLTSLIIIFKLKRTLLLTDSLIIQLSFIIILFNPVLPIYLYEKSLWTIANIYVTVLFFYSLYKLTNEVQKASLDDLYWEYGFKKEDENFSKKSNNISHNFISNIFLKIMSFGILEKIWLATASIFIVLGIPESLFKVKIFTLMNDDFRGLLGVILLFTPFLIILKWISSKVGLTDMFFKEKGTDSEDN